MDILTTLLGTSSNDVTLWQMPVRTVIIFIYAIILFRLAPRRSFGKSTAFDIVLAVILGSTLSRALTANAPLLPTMASAALLILLHILLAKISLFSTKFGHAVKGVETWLVYDGTMDRKAMKRSNITPHDLEESLRSSTGQATLENVESAFLERTGEISFILKK